MKAYWFLPAAFVILVMLTFTVCQSATQKSATSAPAASAPLVTAPESSVWQPPVPRPPAPELSPNTKRLFNYLTDQYGKSIISGQMDTSWTTNDIMDMITRVHTDTGKYPALKGFDFIQIHSNNRPSLGGREQINEAIEWWEGKNNGVSLLPNRPNVHGIVTFCWHWRTGLRDEFYTDRTSFRIPWRVGGLNTESEDFKKIIEDLDKAALRLTTLRDLDIPVLWRPLHEASGGWFWWGASGPRPYIALWEFMYDYFTYEKGLNNLIWVWNGQNKDWYPNPETVDIVGYDFYPSTVRNYASHIRVFTETQNMVPERNRMVALTENGAIPDPDECIKDGAMWSWFMTWNDGYNSQQGDTHKDNFWTGEHHNTQAHKMKVYHHPAVITLDKLPDLTTYRLE
ncbi:MAG: glycoside hydrolase family 26 protein [Treponema sp.]|jgi:mannan endo-1,4-beta-mannosidase|nr:glycoside hydrolase family 26 protein [Treponema sp.]